MYVEMLQCKNMHCLCEVQGFAVCLGLCEIPHLNILMVSVTDIECWELFYLINELGSSHLVEHDCSGNVQNQPYRGYF